MDADIVKPGEFKVSQVSEESQKEISANARNDSDRTGEKPLL